MGSVAVLSPYKAQVGALRALFQARHGAHNLTSVTFATIDGFQVGRHAMTCIIEVNGPTGAQPQSNFQTCFHFQNCLWYVAKPASFFTGTAEAAQGGCMW